MGDRLTSKRLANLCNDNMFIQLDSKMDRQEFSMLAYDAPKYPELYKRLADYEDAEEQGLLRKLPVAVGTKVYYPLRPCGFTTFTIVKIKIYEDEIIFEDDCGNEWEERHFGKVLFLTREEAESALAEKGGAE